MNPEIKAKWLEALRSGRYTQTRGVLNRVKPEFCAGGYEPAGMCCLGVLCDIVDPNRWVKVGSGYVMGWGLDIQTGYPPVEFCEEVGLGSYDMILSARNDSGDTFEQIADYIEANL